MSDNHHFDKLVAAGNPVGEVIGVDRFLVRIRGMQPANIHALVLFADGSKGFVHQILADFCIVLHLGERTVSIGTLVVVQYKELVTKVGTELIGRVLSVNGEPLDGKGPVTAGSVWPVFKAAPMLYERELLDTQLATGVTIVDELFPVVRGQRMALIGDSKAGKSSLATQMAINQRYTDVVVIYVLIAKRRSDIDTLLTRLENSGALESAIVVVSTTFESLVLSYLAPYVACAIGEYLWQEANQDVLIVYDDLTSHAQIYREISLLSQTSPGRESYPGDMFFAHSSLLERAGKLAANHKTMTAIPLVLAAGGDITAYMPTNIMSITDGQWILDMEVFREVMRPAVNTGLSVTRVGGVGHSKRQKQLAAQLLTSLNAYAQAQQYAHFGSELALTAQHDIERGKHLFSLFNQSPEETFSITAQTLMLDIVLNAPESQPLDVNALRLNVRSEAQKVIDDDHYEAVRDCLLQSSTVELKK